MAFTSSYPARSTQHGMALIVVLWRFLRRVFRPRLRTAHPELPAP